MTDKYDLIVLGAGAGGLTITAVAAQLGYRVALLEGHKMGGDCLNYGCVPSKALLAAAKKVNTAWASRDLGLKVGGKAHMAAIHQHVHNTIRAIAPHDSQERFEGLGAEVVREHGFFINRNTIGTESGRRLKGRRIVITTGSRPLVPPIKGLEGSGFYTNETIFDLRKTPEHLLVAGGGPIGVEMAQAFARLGSKVTLIEGGRQLLAAEDPDAAEAVEKNLAEQGVEVIKNHILSHVKKDDKNKYTLTLSKSGALKTVAGTDLLIALGRQPNLERLELENAGVELDGRFIKTDGHLRTSNKRVFAVGDVAGNYQFTHMAGYEAAHVIRRVLFGAFWQRVRYHAVPRVTYTEPEVATTGLTEKAAREKYGRKTRTTTVPFTDNDRARAEGKTEGFLKLNTVKGRPVGVTIYGPQAGELIGLWTLVLHKKLPLSAVSGMIHPYPTLNDISRLAVSTFYRPTFLSKKVRMLSRAMFRLFG